MATIVRRPDKKAGPATAPRFDARAPHALADITPALITEYRDARHSGHTNATVVRYLAALSHAFTVAVRG